MSIVKSETSMMKTVAACMVALGATCMVAAATSAPLATATAAASTTPSATATATATAAAAPSVLANASSLASAATASATAAWGAMSAMSATYGQSVLSALPEPIATRVLFLANAALGSSTFTLVLTAFAAFVACCSVMWISVFLFFYIKALSHNTRSLSSKPYIANSSSLTTFTPIKHFEGLTTASAVPDSLLTSGSDVTQVEPTDIAIVGCGVAGAALCTALARRGFTVRCVERDMTEPHRIVGELLQPGGVQQLGQLGLLNTLDDYDAQDITGYTIMLRDKTLRLSYPHMNGDAVRGRAFHNGRFVMKLRAEALREKERCQIVLGNVRQLVERTSDGRVVGIEYEDSATKKKVFAPAALTIVCDGCFSGLRRPLVENQAKKLSSFLGLVLKDCKLPTALNGHVILADPTPVLVYPISSTEARMLIDFPDTLPSMQRDPATGDSPLSKKLMRDVLPQLPPSIHDSFIRAVRDHQFQSMPNQSMCARPAEKAGVVLIGDSVNMRHPLTGGGMTVAFNDCTSLLSHLQPVQDVNDNEKLDAAIASHYASRDAPVSVINMLADALYAVFCEKYDLLRVSCFNYLSMKGPFSDGPVRLLSGVAASQTLLLVHFFSVAIYGVLCAVIPFPTPSSLIDCVQTLRAALQIITPLILQENRTSYVMRALVYVARTVFWV